MRQLTNLGPISWWLCSAPTLLSAYHIQIILTIVLSLLCFYSGMTDLGASSAAGAVYQKYYQYRFFTLSSLSTPVFVSLQPFGRIGDDYTTIFWSFESPNATHEFVSDTFPSISKLMLCPLPSLLHVNRNVHVPVVQPSGSFQHDLVKPHVLVSTLVCKNIAHANKTFH